MKIRNKYGDEFYFLHDGSGFKPSDKEFYEEVCFIIECTASIVIGTDVYREKLGTPEEEKLDRQRYLRAEAIEELRLEIFHLQGEYVREFAMEITEDIATKFMDALEEFLRLHLSGEDYAQTIPGKIPQHI